MVLHSLRRPLAATLVVLLGLFAAQSVLADTELGDTGNVGAHSLTDTHAQPGARCIYKFSNSFGGDELKTISVRPPNMEASAGRTHQVIGWRFFIERRNDAAAAPHWNTIYKSPLQTTSIGGEGSGFESMSASISLPSSEGITSDHEFLVDVKMVWFGKDDQTVVGSSRHRVDFYRVINSNGGRSTTTGSCGAVLGP